eukprot:TRINITY_DN13755_c0_g1_i1.p1 TRINITY_DN13755_c0_g1~~TRINITY_DN13755_c0_g1_i1.p1  ORF type:complete len:558 (+),score=167.46 TRINITY_DN13755_c0_g1_i1:220-1674(+)
MSLFDEFREPIMAHQRAALSRIGKAENWESGRFLRKQYGTPPGDGSSPFVPVEYQDDASTFFFSERMNRNIQSAEALVLGLFPSGTGQGGFLAERPSLVPILTSQPFEDTLINLPRDGPCTPRYNADREQWEADNVERVTRENLDVLRNFSAVCGFDFTDPEKELGKSLPWAIKAATDAFALASNEGIDITNGGKFDPAVIKAAISVGRNITNGQRFGKEHQITYWVGRFAEDALFANMRDPGHQKKALLVVEGQEPKRTQPWKDSPSDFYEKNRLLVFMNHREIIVGLVTMFGITELSSAPPPAGSMIVWEVHRDDDTGENYIRVLSWSPSQPSWAEKHAYLLSRMPVSELYSYGNVREVFPEACKGQRCTLAHFEDAYWGWVNRTGTWQEVCGLSAVSSAAELYQRQRVLNLDGDDEDGWRDDFERSLFPSPLPPPQPSGWGVLVAAAVACAAGVGFAAGRWGAPRERAGHRQRVGGEYGTC